jgi:hypothetical protein
MKTESSLGKRKALATKTASPTEDMTFGDFIVAVYDTSSEPSAGEIVNFAIDAGLIVFELRGQSHHLPENTWDRIRGASAALISRNESNTRQSGDRISPHSGKPIPLGL